MRDMDRHARKQKGAQRKAERAEYALRNPRTPRPMRELVG